MTDLNSLQHSAYERRYGEKLTEDLAEGLILRHKKTGARICCIASEDTNKSFCIAFRTPPGNSTGVPHIMEHSVLNGSEKYPLKDPFMELAKGSLQTYLNATTYPDKTLYPVASCNDKDFRNLVDVYMDSVLHPNIYHNEMIFRQEGWRYHLENPDDPITLNGVVYSEMKGSFSDPENYLYQCIKAELYPDNEYATCSGGDPEVIPELSYEAFLDFHRRYYHPSNSFILLYGDMDMYEYLDYLDREYLSHYDARPIDSEIHKQPDRGILEKTVEYAIGEEEEEEDHDYLTYSVLLPAGDPVYLRAWNAVTYALFDAPGAPVKQALIDAGIGMDIQSYTEVEMIQPMFVLYAKGADASRKEEFYRILTENLEKIAKDGINRKTLLGYLAASEFGVREASGGGPNRGIGLGATILGNWLYNEDDAFAFCHAIANYRKLRELLDTDYYEQIIRDVFLSHKHELHLTAKASRTVGARQEEALRAKLDAYKASLSEEQIAKLVADTEALRIYQETPDSPELLAKIPLLKISDIHPDAKQYPVAKSEVCGVPVLHYDAETNGIVNLRMILDVTDLPAEELPYLGIFSSALLRMDTKKHSYRELNDELRLHVGDMWSAIDTFSSGSDYRTFVGTLNHYVKMLVEELPTALSYFSEMVVDTDFSDKKRLKEILNEDRGNARSGMVYRGNSVARSACISSFQAQEYFSDRSNGFRSYEFLVDLLDHFDERADELIRHLNGIMAYTLSKKRITFAVICNKELFGKTTELLPGFLDTLKTDPKAQQPKPSTVLPWDGGYPLSQKNEAISYGGRVNYVAQGGNYKAHGYASGGHMVVLSSIISREYLYQNIRVKGGAYGANCTFSTFNGNFSAVTYRDPNIGRTYEVFRGIPEFVRTLQLGERELTKYVIGTVSMLDRPMNVRDEGACAFNYYYLGVTPEWLQKMWTDTLQVSEEKLREQADVLEAVLSEGHIACFGSEAALKQEADLFDSVKGLR